MLENINSKLDKIQLLFSAKPDFEKYVDDVVKWLEKNPTTHIDTEYLNKFDKHVQSLVPNPSDYNSLIVRAGLIGILIADNEKKPAKLDIDLDKLPDNIKEAAKKYNLTPYEIEALKFTQTEGGIYISKVSDDIRSRTKEILLQQQSHRQTSTRDIRKALESEFKSDEGIKTDWEKVSVYETNAAFNNAYIARAGIGEWVLGISRLDACTACKQNINGRLFRVINPPGDYSNLNPTSKEYKRLAELYENCIWVGKNNIGRKRTKQIKKGDTTFVRDHHETLIPAIPMHPLCQCRAIRFIPEEQYIDDKGKLQFRVDNPKLWKEFQDKVFKPQEKLVNHLLT